MKGTATSQPTPEREATDDRLRTERQRTDDELAKTRAEHDVDVDRMLNESRVRMDRVTIQTRKAADATRESYSAPGREERVRAEHHEDAVRDEERKRQDERLAQERASLERDISDLLTRERGETDERLLRERMRADIEIGSRDDTLAMVSHDLRGMLHGIMMSAALLRTVVTDKPGGEAVGRESLRIERYVVRMNRLIDDLLDVARIEAGKLELTLEVDHAERILDEAVDTALPVAEGRGIRLTRREQVEPIRGRYRFDRARILQVLANLIGNAIKFTGADGRIEVGVEEVDERLRFTVSDTGSGIEEEKLGRIFERFAQGEPRSRTGLGLGLYISRCIVDAHGGRIWAESRPGVGSTFYVALPAAPASTPTP